MFKSGHEANGKAKVKVYLELLIDQNYSLELIFKLTINLCYRWTCTALMKFKTLTVSKDSRLHFKRPPKIVFLVQKSTGFSDSCHVECSLLTINEMPSVVYKLMLADTTTPLHCHCTGPPWFSSV